MSESQNRYVEYKNVFLWQYICDHELVVCPRCNKASKVENAEFYCLHCHLHLNECDKFHWYGDLQLTTKSNQSCYHCGSPLFYQNVIHAPHDNFSKKITLECEKCQKQNSVTLQKMIIHKYQGEDYYFGLPLLLQMSCSHGILWAYNWQHLQDLKAFIQADLRERTKNSGNGSLMSRLPLWIKSAKNREGLLKLITKIEKLVQIES
ncbi:MULTISPECIES: hypothetical protein [unclassified Moraxella]|uniref:hypothetical protein n=1 Tax=unclassified Moraxella TaxID=2685852 RepID=UPI003AF9A8CD